MMYCLHQLLVSAFNETRVLKAVKNSPISNFERFVIFYLCVVQDIPNDR